MPGDIHHAEEKYTTALRILATAQGSPRERLLLAYRDSATQAHPPLPGMGPEVPAGVSERIERFHGRMTSAPAVADEGTIAATVYAMSDEEIQAAAEELVDIALALRQDLWENRRAWSE